MKKGFSLIEIMLAIAIASLLLPAMIYVFSLSLISARQGEKYTKAYALAQEQMEGIKTLKENDVVWDWKTTPANTTANEYYQPKFVSGSWQLGSKTKTPVETDGFVKKVKIEEVKRDAAGNLSDESWAIVDDYSRRITVYITWTQNAKNEEVKIDSLVTYY